MSTIAGKPYSTPKNINLKNGLLRFDKTYTSNPFGSTSNGLYINASNQIVYVSQGTSNVIGSTGSIGSVPSLDALLQNDQTLDLGALPTFTIDRSSGNNDVLTITNTGGGSGALIQITNAGSGFDINGTASTWSFTKDGVNIMKSTTIAGTAGSNSLVLTAGDVVFSDASLAITDADNAASLTVTNNTATTASVFVFAGSGTFTGNTTSSFMTITPSGLTTGTALYLPTVALTTGKAFYINYAGTTSQTSGVLFQIDSSATSMTSTGRMFKVAHTGTTGVSTVLSEHVSAATDETVILKVTASAALALGTAFQVSGSSVTTGFGITAANFDSLSSGIAVSIASSSTSLTGAGRLLSVVHSGASTSATTAKIVEFSTAATEDTELFKLTASGALASGIVMQISAAAMTTGIGIKMTDLAALTTGQAISIAHGTSTITDGGSLLRLSSTAANTGGATNATMLDIITTAQVAGTIAQIKGGAMTTGILLSLVSTTGLTSGSVLKATTSTAGALTVGAFAFSGTGAYTSSNAGLFDISATATTAGKVLQITSTSAGQTTASLLTVTASGYTTGYTGNVAIITGCSTTGASNTLSVIGVNTTAGNIVNITGNALTLGTGTALNVNHTTSVLGAGTSLVRISSTGVDTSTTTGVLLDLSTTSCAGSVNVLLTDSSADTTARTDVKIAVTNAAAVGAIPLEITSAAVTGTGSKFKKIAKFANVTMWVSIDGTTANGALTGTAGDICFNGGSNKPEYCTGTTNWTALV